MKNFRWFSFPAMHFTGQQVVIFRTEPDPSINLSDLNGYADNIHDWLEGKGIWKDVVSFGVVDMPGHEMFCVSFSDKAAASVFQAYCNATPSV